MTSPYDDILGYITARFEKLDRQAAEIRESTIKLAVAVTTGCKDPVYTRVLDRILAGYMETPADKLNAVVQRITAEEVSRANSE